MNTALKTLLTATAIFTSSATFASTIDTHTVDSDNPLSVLTAVFGEDSSLVQHLNIAHALHENAADDESVKEFTEKSQSDKTSLEEKIFRADNLANIGHTEQAAHTYIGAASHPEITLEQLLKIAAELQDIDYKEDAARLFKLANDTYSQIGSYEKLQIANGLRELGHIDDAIKAYTFIFQNPDSSTRQKDKALSALFQLSFSE